ncbi:Uncharacterised protein [Yersinia intermedia]|jgi:hypothetical protein|uniref:CdiI immunity protein domain-containing protein n=1 Tax=Yersinia intermedia TaxID=631 RepID=A0ABX6F465_YERIN|nr:hypothetical protein [Yersinia intermedia]EEQ17925.1 hypothetical protein yinte0001_40150 [Yersinia intermedia ATCC 29909]MDA5491909.1 hypothetical protein [Yersinia intermedia]OVZ74216.1 hypothetical protein CBW55_16405 [Yersinia intermedia]QGR68157.1 hypothetical protein FOC38_20860 [Yersinia intermedia]QGR69160.1 hypothetical protein FOC37_01515 [Yersinia intermedia]
MNKELKLFDDVLYISNAEYIYNDLHSIQKDDRLSDVIDLLDEDLLQIKYLNGSIVDVGWYPSFDESGYFKVMSIRHDDWENPIYSSTLGFSLNQLLEEIKMAISKI